MKTQNGMILTRVLPAFVLIITMVAPGVVIAQVPVEVSTEKVVSGGRVYYMHEVQKNQTLYSIAKAYRVSVDDLSRENVIPPNGIQAGQMLKVPAPDQEGSATSQSRPPAQQAAAVTQSRPPAQQAAAVTQPRPAVQPSRPAIASGVPGIDISGEKIVSGGKTYYMHEVQKGQTLYSIARAYRVTILDIDRENSIPPGGIQTGQVLKIPASLAFEVIEEQTPPADAAATPVRGTATATNAPRGNTAADAKIPGQATARQQTRMPFQEQPAARSDTEKPVVDDDMTVKTTEVKENADVKTQTAAKAQPEPEMQQQAQPEVKTEQHAQPEAETRQQAQQQTPSTGKSDDQPKPVQPERRKVHKVQRGESLADIAKKYNITVQELKKANKGVIFAMPDMRLVIPPSKEE